VNKSQTSLKLARLWSNVLPFPDFHPIDICDCNKVMLRASH